MNDQFFDFNLLAFPKEKDAQFNIVGDGKLKVLIIATFPEESKDADYSFLENVLKAANLTPLNDKIFLLQTQDKNLDLSLADLSKKLAVEHILIFGCQLANLGVRAEMPLYKFVSLNNIQLMVAHSIKNIREDRAAKKNQKAAALWQALKGQFLSK